MGGDQERLSKVPAGKLPDDILSREQARDGDPLAEKIIADRKYFA